MDYLSNKHISINSGYLDFALSHYHVGLLSCITSFQILSIEICSHNYFSSISFFKLASLGKGDGTVLRDFSSGVFQLT